MNQKKNERADVVVLEDADGRVTVERSAGDLELGAWYWVKTVVRWDGERGDLKKGDTYEWFGCAMEIGSNYVQIQSPANSYIRVHLDDYWEVLRREEHPEAVIAGKVAYWQGRARELVAQIQAVTARLGVSSSRAVAGPTAPRGQPEGSALVTLSGQTDLAAYKHALTVAKEETIPKLHNDLKEANEKLTIWIKAPALSLEATIVPMRDTIDTIDDRLFSFGLYAGLAETVVRCCDGTPATYDEPLHVMQRRLYMDEEALLDYQAGGMDFQGIADFDAWLCRPENRDRILPFPRTLVAMRVRRTRKERETHGDVLATFISFQEEHADKQTFLYVRNGEQVSRITCEIDFGQMIFPDGAIYREGEPMMLKTFADRVDKLITRAEYEQNVAVFNDLKAKSKEWKKSNPDKDAIENPFMKFYSDTVYIDGFGHFGPDEWEPLDRSNVHFDDAMVMIEAQIKEYNRIAVVIQGLFDRSEILHPHPPVQTWRPDSFSRSVKLVYDASLVLHSGEKPDFEAFRATLNASLGVGSVVVGQERFWMAKEAEKENARRDRTYNSNESRYRYEFYRPHNDPGPGRVATVTDWKPRARSATFRWEREGRRWDSDPVQCVVSVPAADLLNISAYTPGDFKQFFADPRTRAEYLKWAPLLLTAEDWHAGRLRATEEGTQLTKNF